MRKLLVKGFKKKPHPNKAYYGKKNSGSRVTGKCDKIKKCSNAHYEIRTLVTIKWNSGVVLIKPSDIATKNKIEAIRRIHNCLPDMPAAVGVVIIRVTTVIIKLVDEPNRQCPNNFNR